MFWKESEIIYKQSAVLPYRIRDNNYEILLITSLHKKRWIIPKGIIEKGLSARQSALKEAFEEAGIKGILQPYPLGNFSYEKWGGICRVSVYPCEVMQESDEWPEMNVRERRWFSIQDVTKKIDNEDLLKLIKKFIAKNSTV
jgi:8-oxo-dGTP pyrophosphatase MutT (NUDIX family)